jgi:hypothetical protein
MNLIISLYRYELSLGKIVEIVACCVYILVKCIYIYIYVKHLFNIIMLTGTILDLQGIGGLQFLALPMAGERPVAGMVYGRAPEFSEPQKMYTFI